MKLIVKKYIPELILRQNAKVLFDFIESQSDNVISFMNQKKSNLFINVS